MVLDNRGNPGLRFIFGIFLIAVCIYGFYLGLAYRNTPALFVTPVRLEVQAYDGQSVNLGDFTLQLPSSARYEELPDGIYFYSYPLRIRGNVRILDELPEEEAWRRELQGPFSAMFLGDVKDLDIFSLIVKVLRHKYNPTLMGHKAAVLPSWMVGSSEALLHVDGDRHLLLFHIPQRFSGVVFVDGKAVAVNVEGHMTPQEAAFLLASVMPAEDQALSPHN